MITKPRILPAEPTRNEAGRNETRTNVVIVYPGHGTGRTAKAAACAHCGGKPLILRRCSHRRTCAVCTKCGYHHRVPKPK